MSTRPVASISLDLDDLWTYLKVQGDARWRDRPSYLREFVPISLELFERLGLTVTYFIVGADAERPENAAVLRSIVAAGHEVGNHSHEHESWLHTYSDADLAHEVARAEDAIAQATGLRPRGFRGPGYSWSATLLEVLHRRGYAYDASTLPTFIGPLARWYYFRAARLSASERQTRRLLFGRFTDGFRPLTPHWLRLPSGARVLEIPVTTMPVFRTPFHPSYLLFLARRSEAVMHAYLGTALTLCRLRGVAPSVLLHPLDLLGADDVNGLEFFPGMDLPGARKRALVADCLARIGRAFTLQPMGAFADGIAATTRATRAVEAVR